MNIWTRILRSCVPQRTGKSCFNDLFLTWILLKSSCCPAWRNVFLNREIQVTEEYKYISIARAKHHCLKVESRVENCNTLVANATKTWVLATRYCQRVTYFFFRQPFNLIKKLTLLTKGWKIWFMCIDLTKPMILQSKTLSPCLIHASLLRGIVGSVNNA